MGVLFSGNAMTSNRFCFSSNKEKELNVLKLLLDDEFFL
jgi:hypothetical protein